MIHLSGKSHSVCVCVHLCACACVLPVVLLKCQIAVVHISRWENELLPTVTNWNMSQGKQGCNLIMHQGMTPPGCGAWIAVQIYLQLHVSVWECVCASQCFLQDEQVEREEEGRRRMKNLEQESRRREEVQKGTSRVGKMQRTIVLCDVSSLTNWLMSKLGDLLCYCRKKLWREKQTVLVNKNTAKSMESWFSVLVNLK